MSRASAQTNTDNAKIWTEGGTARHIVVHITHEVILDDVVVTSSDINTKGTIRLSVVVFDVLDAIALNRNAATADRNAANVGTACGA